MTKTLSQLSLVMLVSLSATASFASGAVLGHPTGHGRGQTDFGTTIAKRDFRIGLANFDTRSLISVSYQDSGDGVTLFLDGQGYRFTCGSALCNGPYTYDDLGQNLSLSLTHNFEVVRSYQTKRNVDCSYKATKTGSDSRGTTTITLEVPGQQSNDVSVTESRSSDSLSLSANGATVLEVQSEDRDETSEVPLGIAFEGPCVPVGRLPPGYH